MFSSGFNLKGFLSARVSITGVLLWVGALACVFTASAFLGAFAWLFEITSNFRVQYAVCLLALAALFLIRRKFKIVAIFAVFAAANLIVLAPCFWGAMPRADSGGNKMRVLLLNVRTERQGNPSNAAGGRFSAENSDRSLPGFAGD